MMIKMYKIYCESFRAVWFGVVMVLFPRSGHLRGTDLSLPFLAQISRIRAPQLRGTDLSLPFLSQISRIRAPVQM
jgi:hypothetical protein